MNSKNIRMARTVQPALFLDEAIYGAEMEEGLPLRAIYMALHTFADRMGRFSWSAYSFRFLAMDDAETIERSMHTLHRIGRVARYEVGGTQYGLIPDFHKTQFINPREKVSVIPNPEQGSIVLYDGSKVPGKRGRGRPDVNDKTIHQDDRNNRQADQYPNGHPGFPNRKDSKDVAEDLDNQPSEAGSPEVHADLFDAKPAKTTKVAKANKKAPVVVDGFRFSWYEGTVHRVSTTPIDGEENVPVIVRSTDDFSPCIAVFPTTGKFERIGISGSHLDRYNELYPNADNMKRIQQALMWCEDNPANRKTAQGMMRFLGQWITNAQNRGHFLKEGTAVVPTKRSPFRRETTDDRVGNLAKDFASMFETGKPTGNVEIEINPA